MTGARDQPRSSLITSIPSTSGSPRSRMTASGGRRRASARASRPVEAVVTSYLRTRKLIRRARSIAGSSSTTSTRWPFGTAGRAGGLAVCPRVSVVIVSAGWR